MPQGVRIALPDDSGQQALERSSNLVLVLPDVEHLREAIDWAREVLLNKQEYVILDTETTGFGPTDEIIQIAVIDPDGNVLLNENVRPTKRKRILKAATERHGLMMDMLAGCPTFSQLSKPLERAIGRKNMIAYNAAFDSRLWVQSYKPAGGFHARGDWHCAMVVYAHWNDGCDETCQIESCGDGTVQDGIGKQCDDGNTDPGDGCDEDCQIE
ncbi:MAG: exonuclease domain-containing protein [Planctomycetota bacterium]